MVTLVEKLLPGWADPMLIPALCAVSVGRMEAGKQYPHKRKGTRAGPER